MLAEEIKRINSNTRFYIFSKYQPEKSEFVDDFVLKNQFGDIETADILDILGKI
jgi:hypothetical protein